MSVAITSRSKQTLVNPGVPDRAASLKQRRKAKADPTLLGYRRFLEFNTSDACRTRGGIPTYSAISARMWFQKRTRLLEKVKRHEDRTIRAEYFTTFEGCCEVLALDVEEERAKRVARIELAWRTAAERLASEETNRRRNYLLACIGLPAVIDQQYVLGLVSEEEYEEVAGIERPDPPARAPRPGRGMRRR